MRKTVMIGFLAVMAFNAWAGTELRNSCRQVIYAVKPVDVVAGLDDATLRTLARYALGIEVKGQDPLNETDAILASFLFRVELKRRQVGANEFSLFLQEEHEKLQPYIKGRGDVTAYIKMDGWIDLFELHLLLSSF
jgi:hypothetical protein